MEGRPLRDAVASGAATREAVLFGIHGGHVNVSDGRYVYMRAPVHPDNAPLYEYTLMPTHMRRRFIAEELQGATFVEPFSFTKGMGLLKTPAQSWVRAHEFGHLLFDLATDPQQQQPLQDPAQEEHMIKLMVARMQANDAPPEQYVRLGLEVYVG